MDDIITIEEAPDEESRGVPVVAIYFHEDGTMSYVTSLPGPADLLFILEQVKKNILEEDLG